ncbi:hypothetical protein J2X12_002875 [Pseudarthrobacter oxydans]|uniref:Uncharacterized protein n=1 Tax=Pseudarthrobacter oxydans TaxID=1671 RepID=A0AAW8NFF3_PSEOX|nr:hypothetical protein [Pseudarthrobacter oxydans]MDR6794388.1 hypothetical protein [Pseudarthrobacter oxydans]MDR7164837.1 hypothetical protein [Pseudarthrobacter oxydans]
MSARRKFRLTATHPTGRVIVSEDSKLRNVQLTLSYSLYDNGYADKRTAQTACMLKPGERLELAGAHFSIEQVAA